jgi:hypothetical protein
MTLRIVRLSALAVGLFIAAPSLAAVSPLCDDHGKDKAGNKEKNEKKEKQEENKKKPQNPA